MAIDYTTCQCKVIFGLGDTQTLSGSVAQPMIGGFPIPSCNFIKIWRSFLPTCLYNPVHTSI